MEDQPVLREFGTGAISLWESDFAYDSLADAREAPDLPEFLRQVFRRACEDNSPPDLYGAAGLISIVASMYSGVPVDVPTAEDFADEFGFPIDEAMREAALQGLACVREGIGGASEELLGEYAADYLAELEVARVLLAGPPGIVEAPLR